MSKYIDHSTYFPYTKPKRVRINQTRKLAMLAARLKAKLARKKK